MNKMICKPATMDAVKNKKSETAKSKTSLANKKKVAPQEESEALSSIGMLVALEPRIMFDGAALATGAEVLQDTSTADQTVIPGIDGEPSGDSDTVDNPDDALWSSGLSLSATSDRKEIVFIDTSVEDFQTLMEGIDLNAEVILLDSTRDGIEQIAEILNGRTDIDAIHLIAEGNEAQLHLGTTFLTQDAINGQYAQLFTQIGQSLSADADLLIYGCNFGKGDAGLAAMDSLAALTGADIAASTDRTGHLSEFGNWELEVSTGFIETSVVIGEATQEAWEGVLATYTVTNTDDSGAGSFRQAIIDANANAGTDTIQFNIAGAGPHTINVLSALPQITDTVLIDGWSEPDYVSGTPVIELNGGNLGSLVKGLDLGSGSDGSTIRGLIINRFTGTGLEISGSNNHTIQGNWIGLNSAGTGASANGVNGIFGLNSTGNLIGGTTAAQRNIISGNTQQGIFFDNVDNSTISGNYIGTNVSGTGDINGTTANTQQSGVYLSNGSSGNVIGGTTAGSRNVISGNNHYGFEVLDSGSQNNLLQGNYIGTTVTGLAALGNVDGGASFWRAGTGNVFGGSAVGAGNVISGNLGHGVLVGDTTSGATIQGNLIGVAADGVTALGNVKAGIQVQDTASSTTIGGIAAGQGNTIGFNGRDGIYISGGSSISILGNSIYSNVELGIDLGTNGITANDVGDGDTGPNNLQNFPVVTSANSNATGTTIVGSLNSTPSTTYHIEFYANRPSIADSPNGEGERYLGFITVTTSASDADTPGTATFNATLTDVWINAGDLVTATATVDLGGGNYGSTSEFGANATASSTGIIVVDTTSDVGDGTTTSITNLGAARGADGRISLREAIVAANNTAGADKIVFAISHTDSGHYYYANNSVAGTVSTGTITATTASSDAALLDADPDHAKSWWSIQVGAAGLPAITTQMTIDASTQSGFSGTPIIELNGTLVSNGDPNGLTIETSGTTIRGFAINRFGDDAIEIDNQGGGHTIVGNYLGTDVSGLVTTYGNRYGITVKSDGNTIGGTSAGDRNIIAGNSTGGDSFGIGFWQDADNNLVRGNYIGVGADGTTAMSNRQGVTFQGTSDNNLIGGETLGAGNIIAFNSQNGVDVIAGTNNAIVRNSIYSNGLLGINLGPAGVTANDAGDGDTGANRLQNFPVLTSAVTNGTQITITGTLNSTASTNYRIEFYSNATGDGTGYGEGQTFIGVSDVTTDGFGNASFSPIFAVNVSAGNAISATVSRLDGGDAPVETSEFALNVVATAAANTAPTDIVVDSEFSAEETVNSYFTSDQNQPAIAALPAGGYVAVWVSNGQDGSGSGIYGQRFDAAGAKVGAELLVTSEVTDNETGPSISAFSDGGFVVAWQDQTSGVYAWTEARVFNADGSAATAEFKVSPGTDGDGEGYQPAVQALDSARFVVVWSNEVGGSTYQIAGRIYDRGGVLQGSQFTVGSLLDGSALFGAQAEVTLLNDGGFAVAWRTNDGAAFNSQLRIMNGDGTSRSAEIVLGGDHRADVSGLKNGNLVAVYGSGTDIMARIFNPAGTELVTAFTVNTATAGTQSEPSVTRSDDGFVVVWQSDTGDGSTTALFAQRFDASGNRIDGEVLVNTTTSGAQSFPEAIETRSGQVRVIWESENIDGSGLAVVSRVIATGNASVAENATNGTRLAEVLGVFDIDAGDTATYSLFNNAGGRFAINSTTGVITVANASLLDYETNAAHIITVRVTDSGGLTYDEDLTINVTDVNDAPVNTVPGAQVVAEGTAVNITGLSVTDVDGNLSTVQLAVTQGTVTVTLSGAATISSGANGTSTLTLSGSQADINATLASLSYQGTANYTGADTLTMTSTDGNSATDVDVVGFTVTSVNDAPVNTVPGAQTTNEDTALIFNTANGNLISISDDPGETLEVILSVTNGTLTLSQTTGLTITSGANGTATMTVTGTVEDMNSTLDGLQYDPTADYNGSDTLILTTNDATLLALNLDANLQGYFEFSSADPAGDTSPGGTNDGTLNGNATVVSDATRGDVLSLDGSGDYSRITRLVTTSQQVTFSSWVNLAAGASSGEVIDIGFNVSLRLDPTQGVQGSYWDGSVVRWTDSGVLLAGTGWHHVAYTIDSAANTQTIYIDGSVATTTNYTDAIVYSGGDGNTYIGASQGGSYYFEGLIDDARIYDRTLSAGEISNLASAPVAVNDSDTVSITVDPVNDAPVLDNSGVMSLTTITEDDTNNSGDLVSAIIASATGDRITDADSGAVEGIAISSLVSSNGTWQYDIGSGWTDVGSVSTATSLLLRATDSMRFVPDGLNADTAFVTFAAWDQTSGTVGTKVDTSVFDGASAFSAVLETAVVSVTAVNDAPILSGANDLTTINEDDFTNSGTLVSDLISGNISDADGTGSGIAIIGVNNTNGVWEYTIDGGSNWLSLGTPSDSSARLLAGDASTSVRFVPSGDWAGTVSNGLTFHAWDRTSGANGNVVDLSSTQTVADDFSVGSYSNNTGTANWTTAWVEDDDSGGGSLGGQIRIESGQLRISTVQSGDDIYREVNLSGATTATLTFDYDNQLVAEDEIRVRISSNGGASYTTAMGFHGTLNTGTGSAVIDISGYIAADTRIQFYVQKNDTGTTMFIDNVQISYDSGASTGGSTAFSTASVSSDITVTNVDDAAVITGDVSYSGNEGDVVAGDLDATDVDGLTDGTYFTVTTPATNGTAGIDAMTGAWTFTPTNPNWYGSDSFTVTVTDDQGGTTTQVVSVTLANVNDPPVAANDAYATLEDISLTTVVATGVLANDSDLDGDTLSVNATPIVNVSNGTLVLNGDGSFTYTPHANFYGADSFTYQITDGNGGTAQATVTLTVVSVNDVPVITSNSGGGGATLAMAENVSNVTTMTATDSDGDPLTYSIVGGADAGRFTVDPTTGALSFMGVPDFENPTDVGGNNVYDVQMQVSDGQGGTDTQLLAITVTDIQEGTVLPPLPEPTPEPDTEPILEPVPEPELKLSAPDDLPQDSGSLALKSGVLPEGGGDRGIETGAREVEHQEVVNVLDLPPLLRPASWATTSDQIRSYYPDPLDMTKTKLSADILQQLNQFSDELGRTMDDQAGERSWFVNSIKGAGLTLTTGLVAWLVRGGALVAGLMASMPAWRHFDPVPILNMDKKEKETWARRVKDAAKMEAHEHRGLDQILPGVRQEESVSTPVIPEASKSPGKVS